MFEFCKISVLARDRHKPPFFVGSQLRGALGYALKSIVCIKDDRDCKNCEFGTSCVFFRFYQCKNVYHKFRFDFELGMSRYDFSFYLFGAEVENAPIIIASLHKMLCEIGLESSGQKILFSDIFIFVNDNLCFGSRDKKGLQMPLDFAQKFIANDESKDFASRARVLLITPLRIKKHNLFVRDSSLELGDILRSIYARKLSLQDRGKEKMPDFVGKITRKNLTYIDTFRKSNSQQTSMNLGGLVGEILLDGLDRQSYKMLKLGEIIAVGKQCSFGLGKIEILQDLG